MALAASGLLHLTSADPDCTRAIENECRGGWAGYSLTTAQGIASAHVGTLPVNMTDFYGYSRPSTIVYSFNNIIQWTINTSSEKDGYRTFDITGMKGCDVITLHLDPRFGEDSGSVTGTIYYSINSTTSWTVMRTYSSTTAYSHEYIPGVSYGDVVRLRMHITSGVPGVGDMEIYCITGGGTPSTPEDGSFFTVGSGTISLGSIVNWEVAVT